MSNDYFKFQQFTVRQGACAMKVGTDGVLLGAWAAGGRQILDIGTGTGLIALMMAQRFPDARVTGIDIDDVACRQAMENVSDSPFSERIEIEHVGALDFMREKGGEALVEGHGQTAFFDSIVSNPPYFNHSLKNPDMARRTARHTDTLTYADLFKAVSRLLTDDGVFSSIIPFDCLADFQDEARLAGLFQTRICAVRTTPQKAPRRYLLAFAKHPVRELERTEAVLEGENHRRSEWYEDLTSGFYLKPSQG